VSKIESEYATGDDLADMKNGGNFIRGAAWVVVILIPVVGFLAYEVINLMVKENVI